LPEERTKLVVLRNFYNSRKGKNKRNRCEQTGGGKEFSLSPAQK